MIFKPVSKRRRLAGVLIVIPLMIFMLALHWQFIGNYMVTSGSMEPALMVKDRVFMWRTSIYEPIHGDIIVFDNPQIEDELLTKRVVGVPGDRIAVKEGLVYVNDEELSTSALYPANEIIYRKGTAYPLYRGELVVPENEIFVLGDNRNDSHDSLDDLGPVPVENVRGKLFMIYWPFSRFGKVH